MKINGNKLGQIIAESIRSVLNRGGSDNIAALFNLDAIPEEELRAQYVDLAPLVSMSGYGGRFMGMKGKILKEDASETLSIDETKKEMQSKFHFKDWQFAEQQGANGIRLVVLYPGIFKNTKLIQQAMEACGWSVSTREYAWHNHMLWRMISFDPIFQDNVSGQARRFRYLYHWTPENNWDSIKKNGLLPKSENAMFDYPDRLHFVKGGVSPKDILSIGNQLFRANKKKETDGTYLLLAVDLTKVPDDVEFYLDPRYEGGFYTKSAIPVNAISIRMRYDFNLGISF